MALSSHHATEPTMAHLVDLIQNLKYERKIAAEKRTHVIKEEHLTLDELSSQQMEKLGLMMFGNGGPGNDERNKRLFRSTIHAGFPRAGMFYQCDPDPLGSFLFQRSKGWEFE